MKLRLSLPPIMMAVIVLLWCSGGTATSASNVLSDYEDMRDDGKAWYNDTMVWGMKQGVITGYEEAGIKRLRPGNPVTEAEFLTMLMRFYPNTRQLVSSMEDAAPSRDWTAAYYHAASLYRVPVKGTADREIRNKQITRGQVAQMLASAFGARLSVTDSIRLLYDKELSQGRNGRTVAGFEAEGLLTRAEAVRFLQLLDSKSYGERYQPPSEDLTFSPGLSEPLNRFGIYYGTPSLVNGAGGDVQQAVNEFKQFQQLIFGNGVQDPGYWDFGRSSKVIRALAGQGKDIFGYVDLGVATSNLSYEQMEQAVLLWKELGAAGIYLDNAGYDFKVTRERQNHMIGFIHKNGLHAFMGAWNPDDIGGDRDENGNPSPSLAGKGDWYLSESWLVSKGSYMPVDLWQEKTAKCIYYQETKGIRTAAASTAAADGASADDRNKESFVMSWWAAALYGFPMFWSDYHYSAGTNRIYHYADLNRDWQRPDGELPIAVTPNQTILRTEDGFISVYGDGKQIGIGGLYRRSGGQRPKPVVDGSRQDWSDVPVFAQGGQGTLKLQASDKSISFAVTGKEPAFKKQLFIKTASREDKRLDVAHWSGFHSDRMVEADRFYRYGGSGKDWVWNMQRVLDSSSYALDPSGTDIEAELSYEELGIQPGVPQLLQAGYIGDDKTASSIPGSTAPFPVFLVE